MKGKIYTVVKKKKNGCLIRFKLKTKSAKDEQSHYEDKYYK
jgi:hypothetical protein